MAKGELDIKELLIICRTIPRSERGQSCSTGSYPVIGIVIETKFNKINYKFILKYLLYTLLQFYSNLRVANTGYLQVQLKH